MSDTGLEGCVTVVIDAGEILGGGVCSALTLTDAAFASSAISFITEQTVEIDGGWAKY